MQRRRILIIGGGGFFGRALARELVATGHTVTCLDARPMTAVSPGERIVVGDLGDANLLGPLLHDCDTLVHLASATTPSSSASSPLMEAENNIGPTLRLLELAQNTELGHIVFASSGGTVYGHPTQLPATESLALAPHSYHAAGKIALEAFFNAYRHLTGKIITILRPSNLYGPGQPLKSGFGVIRTMLEHQRTCQPMPVWGDGGNVRDYLYIADMVAACRLLIDRGCDNDTFNVGASIGTSILQLIALIEQITGRPMVIDTMPARALDVRAIVLDSNKLTHATGWQPQIGLEEGIRRTWEWLNAN